VFATAGSENKREYLRSLGIESPLDSRSTEFADRIMELTGGEGVDVVLNTLSGAEASRGLEILRPFGRFLQLDKQEIFRNSSLELGPFKRGLSFTAIDLSLFLMQPGRLQRLFQQVADGLSRGDFSPVRTTVYPVRRLGEALSALSRYQHLGKLVLSYA
jgi:NADPH:quinone reductase-like Zn-dependent oxidoreductase